MAGQIKIMHLIVGLFIIVIAAIVLIIFLRVTVPLM
jgi:hypothetical protein